MTSYNDITFANLDFFSKRKMPRRKIKELGVHARQNCKHSTTLLRTDRIRTPIHIISEKN